MHLATLATLFNSQAKKVFQKSRLIKLNGLDQEDLTSETEKLQITFNPSRATLYTLLLTESSKSSLLIDSEPQSISIY